MYLFELFHMMQFDKNRRNELSMNIRNQLLRNELQAKLILNDQNATTFAKNRYLISLRIQNKMLIFIL